MTLDQGPSTQPKRRVSALHYFFWISVLGVASTLGLISFFGDNIRALFSASADAGLVGHADRVVLAEEPPPQNPWNVSYQGQDLGIEAPAPRYRPHRTLEDFAREQEARKAAARHEHWDRSEQSVWRYEYPPEGSE